MPNTTLPSDIQFGNRQLSIPEDISVKEVANLTVVLALASSGALSGAQQTDVNAWLLEMGVDRLFSIVGSY